jgi:hypothetical protein
VRYDDAAERTKTIVAEYLAERGQGEEERGEIMVIVSLNGVAYQVRIGFVALVLKQANPPRAFGALT